MLHDAHDHHHDYRHDYRHDHRHDHHRGLTRRAALQLGASAGVAAIAAPYVARLRLRRGAVDLSGARPTLTPIPSWPVPPMITRAQWGANESLREPGQIYDTTIQKIVVHHTGTPNSITDYASLCRGIFTNEVANEYIDIAYNWLIDPNGKIYEGRWARDYPAGTPHTGEKNSANVRGAHALYANSRTIGVALMGNYDAVDPPPAMINGLVTLLAWKCARWGLDPLGHGQYVASNGVVRDLDNICEHRDTSATACPGARTDLMMPAIRAKVAARISGAGYWVASAAGQVVARGGVPAIAGITAGTAPIAGIARHPAGTGFWLFGSDGNVYPRGGAGAFGSMQGKYLAAPIVGMAATPTGKGYWLVGRDGGIFTFGDARFLGSTGAMRLNAPVLGMTPTKTGKGYWIYARDGGIFTFGDARFYGSTGNIKLNRPVVGMAARPQGDGYWMVAADGGVFSFGKAPFVGSGAKAATTSPCVAMLASTSGKGYVLLRRDGSVRAFGDAPYLGNAVGLVSGSAVGIAGKLKAL